MPELIAVTFYKFVNFPDFKAQRDPLQAHCIAQKVKGSILIADEGINGTIAGERSGIESVLDYLHSDKRLADLTVKVSPVESLPFYRMKVRLKKEIITLGVPEADPRQKIGPHVAPEDWNALLADPEVTLVDTRNDYEVRLGTFKGAQNPEIQSFGEFPAYVNEHLTPEKNSKVALFCTGGIRCEKAALFMLNNGFKEVYQLDGGILKYLEETPVEKSLWDGECFVFDQRVSVDHALNKGSYSLCYACREPLSKADLNSEFYEKGVSCPHCYESLTAEKRRRMQQRQYQVELARSQDKSHIGSTE